jgi:hypothetical protein
MPAKTPAFSTPRFPPCAAQGWPFTLRRVMPILLRRIGFTFVAGLVIFCCSCQRHHVGELPAEPEPGTAEKHAAGAHVSQSPEARMTPANFFPANTPH